MKEELSLEPKINKISEHLGDKSFVEIKKFFIGKNTKVDAAIIYMYTLCDKESIDKDILNPLMLHVNEDISGIKNMTEYLCKRYIISSGITIKKDLNEAIQAIQNGNTVLLLNITDEFVIIPTKGGTYRQISDPSNEASMRGPKEGFIENVDTNISMIKRLIKDNNLSIESHVVGKRSQTRVSVMYLNDIADREIINELNRRIEAVDVDFITAAAMLEQFLEEKSYSAFPQLFGTERPDRVVANLMEGKIAVIVDGSNRVLLIPALLHDFFNTVEDYYSRTVVSSAIRLLRHIATIIVLFFPSIYLVLIKFNGELIPVQLIVPIVESRSGISLTPFMEIVFLEIIVELLREGGLRLPSKIAQTLSIVGGIIIGDMAVQSKMVSPTTLLIIGITVVSSFTIPNYEMSLSIRFLRFPILLFSNYAGLFGIGVSFIFILIHLSALENFGVPYMTYYKEDLKDIFLRAPLWKMNQRPTAIPNNNSIRQQDFRQNFGGKK